MNPGFTHRTILKAIGEPGLSLSYSWKLECRCFFYRGQTEPVAKRMSNLPPEQWVAIGRAFVAKVKSKR